LVSAECLHQPGDVERLGRLLVRAASDSAWQRDQAQRNFQHAGTYAGEVLDARRRAFWQEFSNEVTHGQGR
jgi:hypothetical protein